LNEARIQKEITKTLREIQEKLKKENRKTNKIFQFGRESSLYAYFTR